MNPWRPMTDKYHEADAWEPIPRCLASAYERRAVHDGLSANPEFLENKMYLEYLRSGNADNPANRPMPS